MLLSEFDADTAAFRIGGTAGFPFLSTHTTVVLRLFWILSGTTRVSRYQKAKIRKVKPIWIYWSKRQ